MTDNSKKKNPAEDIENGLEGLFGALGDAIGQMVSRLEEGTSGAVNRDHVFETPKGPIRAHAGVKLRMGGMDVDANNPSKPAKPVNPNRPKPQPTTATRPLEYDIFEDDDTWMLTADLPGVGHDELDLRQDGQVLHLNTTGTRKYETSVDLGWRFESDAIEKSFHNGVLTLQIERKKDQ